jgi:hypothetical protein
MNAEHIEEKLTDELERKLIERELEKGQWQVPLGTGALLLELIVGSLLVLGILLLAVPFF